MKHENIVGVSDEFMIRPDGVTVTAQTPDGPLMLSLPIIAAERFLVGLRAAADDVHRLREERGDPIGKIIAPADRAPLDTVGCMAIVVRDGRILLQFRHAVAATTALFLSRQGAAILAKTLLDLVRTSPTMARHGAKTQP